MKSNVYQKKISDMCYTIVDSFLFAYFTIAQVYVSNNKCRLYNVPFYYYLMLWPCVFCDAMCYLLFRFN